MIFDNVRTETMNRGDMNAMLAACQLGSERFLRLVERYGADVVMSAAYDWMDYSERMLRAEIAKIPDGEYGPDRRLARRRRAQPRRAAAGRDEGDRRGRRDHDRPDRLEPGGADRLQRPVRGLAARRRATTRSARSCSTRSTFPEHVPQNDGVFRPVKVIAPKGTIFNPNFPRACFSRFCQVQRVVDNIDPRARRRAAGQGHRRATRPGSTSARTPASTRRSASTGSTSR